MPQYTNDIIAISGAMTGVFNTTFPEQVAVAAAGTGFVQAYSSATADALTWVNDVLARLLTVPQQVLKYDTVIGDLFADAAKQIPLLGQQSTNATASSQLASDLTELTNTFGLVDDFISGAVTALTGFKGTLAGTAANLVTIAATAAAGADVDQVAIQAVNAKVSTLQADIANLNGKVLADGLVSGAAESAGIVMTFVALPAAVLTWIVCGSVMVGEKVAIDDDNDQITSDQQEITTALATLGPLEAQCAVLQVLAQSYGALATRAATVENNLSDILADWTSLSNSINAAISSVASAVADGTDSAAVSTDLASAQKSWTGAVTAASAMAITINVNSAQVIIGQPASEVQSALAAGTVTGAIEYYNSVGSAS